MTINITSFKLSHILNKLNIDYGVKVNHLGYHPYTFKCILDPKQNLIQAYSLNSIREYLFHKHGININLETNVVTRCQNNKIIETLEVPLLNHPKDKTKLLDEIIFTIFKLKLYVKNL